MNKTIQWVGIAIALVLGIYANIPETTKKFGTAGGMLIENYIPAILYNDGYKSEREIVLSGANGDLTVGGGLVTVTTAASATSTLIVGGVQLYATSSATSICIVPVATTTNMLTGNSLALQAKYGTCPF